MLLMACLALCCFCFFFDLCYYCISFFTIEGFHMQEADNWKLTGSCMEPFNCVGFMFIYIFLIQL